MKRQALLAFGIAPLLAILGASMALAQISRDLVATVPFSFHVAGILMPAGEYVIGPAGSIQNVIWLENAAGRTLALAGSVPVQSRALNAKDTFIFNRYGNKHFLAGITYATGERWYVLLKSKLEKELIAGGPSAAKELVAANR